MTKCRHCGEWLDKTSARKASGELPPAVKLIAIVAMVALALLFVLNFF